MTTDARGNIHRGSGAPGAGEFTKKQNPMPATGLSVPAPLPRIRKVSAEKVKPGQLVVVGEGTTTTFGKGEPRRVFDARETVEVTSAEWFGRRFRVGYTRQDGTTGAMFLDEGSTLRVTSTPFAKRELDS